MVYITVKQNPKYHQMSFEEFFNPQTQTSLINLNIANTKTYVVESPSDRFLQFLNVDELIGKLVEFNKTTENLRQANRESLYHTFYLPKKSGRGLRRIDAPQPELMSALRVLKGIFENDFKALYHTSAFAYVKNRSTLDAVKRHQANESKWFGKYDLSNFFGSTTLDFVMQQFSMVYPFSEVVKNETGACELKKAVELAFLNGGLPQGTPISPLITNVMMIPIDFALNRALKDFNGQRFVYTRYADDFIISSRYHFNPREVEDLIVDKIREFHAPFCLNSKKTRYGSSSGHNVNLGVVLNKDNQITVGYKKKRDFKAMLNNYVKSKLAGEEWERNDVQVLEGYRNYYRMVEGSKIDDIVDKVGHKYGVDIPAMLKADLK